MATEQRYPHEIVPAPDADTGTAAEWSTYHLVRACAYSKLIEHLVHVDDYDSVQAATNGFIGQFALSHLLDKVSDDDARELEALIAAGDAADELIWERLAKRGIDPDTVRRFTSRAEHLASQATS